MTDLTKSGEEEDPGPPVTELRLASAGMEDDRVGMSTRRTRRAKAAGVQEFLFAQGADENVAEEDSQSDKKKTIIIDLCWKAGDVRSKRAGHCSRNLWNRVPTPERFDQGCGIEQQFSDANLGKKQVGVITTSPDDEQRQMQQQAEQRQVQQAVRRWSDWCIRKPRSDGGQRVQTGRCVEAGKKQNLPKWPQKKRGLPRNQARNGGMRSAGQTLRAPNVRVSGAAESSGERHRSQGSSEVGDQQRILESIPNRGKGTRKAPVKRNSSSRTARTPARGNNSAGHSMVPTMGPLPAHVGVTTPKAKKPPRPGRQKLLDVIYQEVPSSGGLLSNSLPGDDRPTFNVPNLLPASFSSPQNLAHGLGSQSSHSKGALASDFASFRNHGRAPSLGNGHGTGAAGETFYGIGNPSIRGGEMNGPGDESFESPSQSEGLMSSGDEDYLPRNRSGNPHCQAERNECSLAAFSIQYARRGASSHRIDGSSQNYPLTPDGVADVNAAPRSIAGIGDEHSRPPAANALLTARTREPMLSAFHTNSVHVPTSLSEDESAVPNVETLREKNSNGGRGRREPFFDLNELPELASTQKSAKRKKLRPKVLRDDAKVRKPKTTAKKKPATTTPKPKKAATPRRSKAPDTQTPAAEKRTPKRRNGASDATLNQQDGQSTRTPENGGRFSPESDCFAATVIGSPNVVGAGTPGTNLFPGSTFHGQLGPICALQSSAGSPIFGHIQASPSILVSPAEFPSTPVNNAQYQTWNIASRGLAVFDSPSAGHLTPNGGLQFSDVREAAVFRTPTFSNSPATPSEAFPSGISPAGNNLSSGSSGRKRSGQQSFEGQPRAKRLVRSLFHNSSNSAGDENGLALAPRLSQCEAQAATQMTTLSLGQTQAGMSQLQATHLNSEVLMVSPANASESMTESASCTADASSPRRLRDAARRTRTMPRRKRSDNSQTDLQNALNALNSVRMLDQHVDGMAVLNSEESLAAGLELATVTQSTSVAVAKRKKIKGKACLEKEDLRMFKLIMTHGAHYYDPKDPQAEKWARERIFMKRRAEEFISRMHIFQGDRQFKSWGGSVTDSVVGAFLTQNVSDHLSSSAFINVISTWPTHSDFPEEEEDEDGWDAGVTVEEWLEGVDSQDAPHVKAKFFVDEEHTESDVDKGLGGMDGEANSKGKGAMEETDLNGKGVTVEVNCEGMDFEGEARCEASVSQLNTTLQNNLAQCGVGTSSCAAEVRTSCYAMGEATPIDGIFVDLRVPGEQPLEECNPSQAGSVAGQDDGNLAAEQELDAPACREGAIETESEEVDGCNDGGCQIVAESKSGLFDLNVKPDDCKGAAETELEQQVDSSASGLVKQSPKSILQSPNFSDESPLQSSGIALPLSDLEDGGSSGGSLQPGAAGCRELGVEEMLQELREDAADFDSLFQGVEVGDHGGAEKSPKVLENEVALISPTQNVGEACHDGDEMLPIPREFTEAPTENAEAPAENMGASTETTEVPIHSTEALFHSTEAPIHSLEAPIHCTEAPIHSTEAPIHSTEAPIHGAEAMENTEAHSHSSKKVEKMEKVYIRRPIRKPMNRDNVDMEDLATAFKEQDLNAPEGAKKSISLRTYARRVSPTQLNPGSNAAPRDASPSGAVVSVSDPKSDTLSLGREAERAGQGNEVEIPGRVGSGAVIIPAGTNERKGRRGKRGLTAAEIREIEIARTNASKQEINWEEVRKKFGGGSKEASLAAAKARENGEELPPEELLPEDPQVDTSDMGDWAAMKDAPAEQLARVIRERGMGNMLSVRIMGFLQRLQREHGTTSLQWLKKVPPETAKAFLMSIRGLGLKSVECIRLLTLHQHAFPVDTNVGRICVRLGWVPIEALPSGLLIHNLELYPVQEAVQKYLWPRLCKFGQKFLYELHYQLITFGKVFCTKTSPNCHACPMNDLCAHYQSIQKSRNMLPAPDPTNANPGGGTNNPDMPWTSAPNVPRPIIRMLALEAPVPDVEVVLPETVVEEVVEEVIHLRRESSSQDEVELQDAECRTQTNAEASTSYAPEPRNRRSRSRSRSPGIVYRVAATIPLIEEPHEDIEGLDEDDLNYFGGTLPHPKTFRTRPEDPDDPDDPLPPREDYMKAVVQLRERMKYDAPPLKQAGRLRTSHYVYELPDNHPVIKQAGLRRRREDDPTSYLLVVWGPDQKLTKNPGLEDIDDVEDVKKDKTNGDEFVRGTILIPCRSAMRGKFPLNGTYFQVNEVFADHASSVNPMQVPRKLIWGLRRRFVYFGTSVTAICRGLTQSETQACFWKGYVCVRGFDSTSKAPMPLHTYLHEAASRIARQPREAKAAGQRNQPSGGEAGTAEGITSQQEPKPRKAARQKKTAADPAEEGTFQ